MSDRYCPACNGYGIEPRCPICNQAKQSIFMRDLNAAGGLITTRSSLFGDTFKSVSKVGAGATEKGEVK